MNQPNIPPGYGAPQQPQYPPQGAVPNSASYPPPQGYAQPQPGYAQSQYPQQAYPQPPHGIRGMTRQMFNPASYRQQGSGSWAAASLILSLVSAIFCLGLISPLPMLLGLLGMIGNKRAKGMAFAGFTISFLQVGAWAALMGLGFHQVYWADQYAAQAGAPVVAAIEEFKTDNKRAPYDLDELVSTGYLPDAWTTGFDGLDGSVKKVVDGAKWNTFLRYKPGAEPGWEGENSWVGQLTNAPRGNTPRPEKPDYSLAFIGVDNKWGSTDDRPVAQDGAKFDLQQLFGGGDAKTREITKKRRELQKMLQSLESKSKYYETALGKARDDLEEAETDLQAKMDQRGLSSLEQVKGDKVASKQLLLIGEIQKRLMAVEKKKMDAVDTYDSLKVEVKRLANQEEMSKLAESPKEMAALDTLLEDSRKALDEKSGLGELDKLSEQAAAEKWFKEKFK